MVLARVVGLKGKYQTVGAVCLSTHAIDQVGTIPLSSRRENISNGLCVEVESERAQNCQDGEADQRGGSVLRSSGCVAVETFQDRAHAEPVYEIKRSEESYPKKWRLKIGEVLILTTGEEKPPSAEQ